MSYFKKIVLFSSLIAAQSIAFASGSLKLGVMAGASTENIKTAVELAKNKYDLTLNIISFTDYQMPNEALNSGDLDANIFQTRAFLDQAINKRGYKLSVLANTFIYPMGLFSKKIKNLQEIRNKGLVLIPNDSSNQDRALHLLQEAKLIALKAPNNGTLNTIADIIINPKKLEIRSIDAAQITRSLQDADLTAITNDFVALAHLSSKDALLLENGHAKSVLPYINVIVIRSVDLKSNKSDLLQELKQIIQSKDFEQSTQKFFPGAVALW